MILQALVVASLVVGAVTSATPLVLIWMTLRGTTPGERAELLPGLAAGLRAVDDGMVRRARTVRPGVVRRLRSRL